MTDTVPVPDAQLDANCADGASMSGDAPKPDTHDPLPIQRWECYDPHEIGMLDDGDYVTYADHLAAVAAARAEIVTVDFDGDYAAGYRAGLIEGDTKGRREGKRIAERRGVVGEPLDLKAAVDEWLMEKASQPAVGDDPWFLENSDFHEFARFIAARSAAPASPVSYTHLTLPTKRIV